MKQGKVLISGVMEGIFTEDETEYTFAYDSPLNTDKLAANERSINVNFYG